MPLRYALRNASEPGKPIIVLDGRTDREKLDELLRAGEQTHLDYKASIDWSSPKEKLSFVKDVVALSNRPQGGYLLVGVDDTGAPCTPLGSVDRRRFDGATLGQVVRAYIEGQIEIHTQVHELDSGHEVVLVRIEGHRDGLPVPMAKDGQYPAEGGRSVHVFRTGDVVVREGSANVPLRHAHWPDLLSERDRQIREQAQRDAQALISQVVSQLQNQSSGNSASSAPLALAMDESTFADAVVVNLEGGKDVRLRSFVAEAKAVAMSSGDAAERALAIDRLSVVGAQAIFHERWPEATSILDALYDIYLAIPQHAHGSADRQVELVSRVYALGSLAVRQGAWELLPSVVERPVSVPPGGGYIYPSWLRHAQVEGSRAELWRKDQGGLIISVARALLTDHPALRPDVPTSTVPPADALEPNDVLLNSLCQFDLAYCVMVTAKALGDSMGYPSAASFYQERSNPMYARLAEPKVRRLMMPESTDQAIAEAIAEVQKIAHRESLKYGAWWHDLPQVAAEFVESAASV